MVSGRRLVSPSLAGVTIDDWTPLIYCQNDLGGAWEEIIGELAHDVCPAANPNGFRV